jgi:hypothetical protein
MKIVPRPWWRPVHNRIAAALWILCGGRGLIRFPAGTTMTVPGEIELKHLKYVTIDFKGATIVPADGETT